MYKKRTVRGIRISHARMTLTLAFKSRMMRRFACHVRPEGERRRGGQLPRRPRLGPVLFPQSMLVLGTRWLRREAPSRLQRGVVRPLRLHQTTESQMRS